LILESLDRDYRCVWRLDPEFRNNGSLSRGKMAMIKRKFVPEAPQRNRKGEPAKPEKI
jgi:hypothetical protein